LHRPEERDPAKAVVHEQRQAAAAGGDQRQVADEVVDRVAELPAEVVVAPELAVVAEPDEIGVADEVPLLQARPDRAYHRIERERQQANEALSEEGGDDGSLAPSAHPDHRASRTPRLLSSVTKLKRRGRAPSIS